MNTAEQRAAELLAHGRDLPDELGRNAGRDAATALEQLELIGERTADLMDVNQQLVPLIRDFKRQPAKPGWQRWFTGEDLEHDVFFDDTRRRIETLAEMAEQAHPALKRQTQTLQRLHELLGTEIACLEAELAAARCLGTPEWSARCRTAGLDDDDLARLSRRTANLEALATATQLTRAQFQMALQHARDVSDRHREVRTLLMPIWKQAVGLDLFARRVSAAGSAGAPE